MMQYRRKYEAKIVMKVSGSKAEMCKFHDVWKSEILWLILIYMSIMFPVTLCIVLSAERQAQILLAKPNLLSEIYSLNVKVLFIK
jgi:hypothetical protein